MILWLFVNDEQRIGAKLLIVGLALLVGFRSKSDDQEVLGLERSDMGGH